MHPPLLPPRNLSTILENKGNAATVAIYIYKPQLYVLTVRITPVIVFLVLTLQMFLLFLVSVIRKVELGGGRVSFVVFGASRSPRLPGISLRI